MVGIKQFEEHRRSESSFDECGFIAKPTQLHKIGATGDQGRYR